MRNEITNDSSDNDFYFIGLMELA